MLRLVSTIKIKENEILVGGLYYKEKKKAVFGLFTNGEDLAKTNVRWILNEEPNESHEAIAFKIPLNEFVGIVDNANRLYIESFDLYLSKLLENEINNNEKVLTNNP